MKIFLVNINQPPLLCFVPFNMPQLSMHLWFDCINDGANSLNSSAVMCLLLGNHGNW